MVRLVYFYFQVYISKIYRIQVGIGAATRTRSLHIVDSPVLRKFPKNIKLSLKTLRI